MPEPGPLGHNVTWPLGTQLSASDKSKGSTSRKAITREDHHLLPHPSLVPPTLPHHTHSPGSLTIAQSLCQPQEGNVLECLGSSFAEFPNDTHKDTSHSETNSLLGQPKSS